MSVRPPPDNMPLFKFGIDSINRPMISLVYPCKNWINAKYLPIRYNLSNHPFSLWYVEFQILLGLFIIEDMVIQPLDLLLICFSAFLHPINKSHSYSTRSSSSGNYYISHSRLNQKNDSFSIRGAKIWNSIPENLRNSSKSLFKEKVHAILLKIFEA